MTTHLNINKEIPNINKEILPFWVLLIFITAILSGSGKHADAGMELSDEQKKDAVYGMYGEYKKDFPAVSDITPTAAMALLKQGGVIFVDTRKPEEMEVSMLPAAITGESYLKIPASYKNKTVVAYCTIGYRSGLFAKEMEAKGIMVRNLSGGIVAWALEGGLLYDKNGETKRIHVYGDKWNFAPMGYEAVVFGMLHKILN
jgi:sodium/bile acid cotransporter 7